MRDCENIYNSNIFSLKYCAADINFVTAFIKLAPTSLLSEVCFKNLTQIIVESEIYNEIVKEFKSLDIIGWLLARISMSIIKLTEVIDGDPL